MLTFSKISQMSRAVGMHCNAHFVPLTKAFDCASPNSRINNILNQWYYMQQEERNRKARIKAEKAKKLEAKYHVNLLPDYSKKTEKEPEKVITKYSAGLRNLDYITTATNQRISPEFLTLLHRQNLREARIGEEWLEPVRPGKEIDIDRPLTAGKLEQMNPRLAKYLRETMERNDLMNKMYDINFYDRTDPYNLKHILNLLNKRGTTVGLTPEQLAKLQKFLELTSKLSPEEFEQQLRSLKADGFLSGTMVDYLEKLLRENVGGLNTDHMRKQMAALQRVDTNFANKDHISGHGTAFYPEGRNGGQHGGKYGEKHSGKYGSQHGKPGGPHGGQAYSFFQQQQQGGQNDDFWNATARQRGLRWGENTTKGGGYQYSYDYQQNVGGDRGKMGSNRSKSRGSMTNRSEYGNDGGDGIGRNASRKNFNDHEQLLGVHRYSFDNKDRTPGDIFGNKGNTRSHFEDPRFERDTEKYEKQYFHLLAGPKKSKTDGNADDNANATGQFYVRHPWERTPMPKMLRTVKNEPVQVKKRISPYKIPLPKQKPPELMESMFDKIEEPKRNSKQVKLMFIPRVKKAEAPKLPDRNRKISIAGERFAEHGYLEPPKIDSTNLKKFISTSSYHHLRTSH